MALNKSPKQALDDLLGARIAVLAPQVGSGLQQLLHFLRPEHFHAHDRLLLNLFLGGITPLHSAWARSMFRRYNRV